MGTEGYIAPEIAYKDGAKNADERCDVYSLGGLIFNVLTGKSPLFLSPSLLSADIFPIVSKCRKFNPDQRYQNAKEVGDAIKTAIKVRISFVDMVNLLANINNMSKNNFRENAVLILTNSTSLSEFISNYNTLGNTIFIDLIEHNLNYANHIAYIYYQLVKDLVDEGRWINFDDIDIICHIACILYSTTNSEEFKANLASVAIIISVENNRWHAEQEVYNRILSKWNSTNIQPFINVIKENKQFHLDMEKSINVQMSSIIRMYYN